MARALRLALRTRNAADAAAELKALDSDLQTLVYENYNKFISATDTIRQMKSKVESMDGEIARLADTMATITDFSGRVNATLSEKHTRISQLTGIHALLKKLQFLFELPARLKKCIEMDAISQAVRYYVKARSILHQVRRCAQHTPRFRPS